MCVLLLSPGSAEAGPFQLPTKHHYDDNYSYAMGRVEIVDALDYSTDNFIAFVDSDGDSLDIIEITMSSLTASAGDIFMRVSGTGQYGTTVDTGTGRADEVGRWLVVPDHGSVNTHGRGYLRLVFPEGVKKLLLVTATAAVFVQYEAVLLEH